MKILFTFSPMDEIKNVSLKNYKSIFCDHELNSNELVNVVTKEKPDALIVTLNQSFDEDVIESMPSTLKIIATTSVGYNHIDIRAANKRGIVVTNTPDVVTDCTADIALLLMLGASRNAREGLLKMEKGWGKELAETDLFGKRVTGKRLGIIGMGRIGQAFAQRARALNMKIIYHNRTQLPDDLEKGATYYKSLDDMLPHCDYISLNAPATSETLNIMGEKQFSLLPQGAIFINTSRGSLVNEQALINSLKSGHLYSAGLDVYVSEPSFNKDLLTIKNIFLLPHLGTATYETRLEMGLRALDNVFSVLKMGLAKDRILV